MIEDALIDSVPWRELRSMRGDVVHVPEALHDLLNASSEEDAEEAYWRLDNNVVVQGQLFDSAVRVIGPLLLGLVSQRPGFVREHIANLLVEIAVGGPHESVSVADKGEMLDAQCHAELRRGLWIIYKIIDDPVPMVRLGALDLLDAVEDDRERMAVALACLEGDPDARVAQRVSELSTI
ncbi:hypothetical protein AB0K15_39710 [Amycolatopsis sp. NPDC049253]|uniref:hypothetical protein n=1 Tax=Amycolatopsis sp. NPDC049253 TaxID=3155274 RepID=UPI003423EF6C